MMRLWLSKNSAASLRDQLATQIALGVISGDLRPGEKLPSVRELARRYKIHSNTVSAAYHDVAGRGWLELRKGSGLYVRDPRQLQTGSESDPLEVLIQVFLTETRARGFSSTEVFARLSRVFGAGPVRRVVVVEPEPEMREVLAAELREHLTLPVVTKVARWQKAAALALVSRAHAVRTDVPPDVPRYWLRPRSVPEHLQGQQRPTRDALIGVASSSPEILRQARTILAAAGLDPDALEFRDAREAEWTRGLDACAFVITDVVTARRLSKACTARVLRVLSDASIADLRRFLALVTPEEAS